MTDLVTIPRDVLQKVLDFAVSADSACSGYADDEEVEALRAAAVALGVDPIDVTPFGFRCKYLGKHTWWIDKDGAEWRTSSLINRKPPVVERFCSQCKHRETRPATAADLGIK